MTKTYELIYLNNNIIAIDREAEIKEGDYCYFYYPVINEQSIIIAERSIIQETICFKEEYYAIDCCSKIIASKLPLENLPLIPQSVFEKHEEDVEKLAEKWVFETNGHKWSNNDNSAGDNYASFIAGYQAAKSKQKEFAREDIIKAFNAGKKKQSAAFVRATSENIFRSAEKYLSSLQQSKPKALEVEMTEIYQYYSSKYFYGKYADWVNTPKAQYESIKKEIPTCPTRILIQPKTNEANELIITNVVY